MYLLDQEVNKRYPGGQDRKWARRFLLCQHIRSASISLVHEKYYEEAFHLYRRTWAWQLRFKRVRYLAGLPSMILESRMRDTV
jgi:hypothetical protein